MADEHSTNVLRLIGIYNADGSLLGELRYVVGRARGTAHCGLCDVTHGAFRKKRAFAVWQAAYPVPIDLLHLDEQPAPIAELSGDHVPCVIAETDDGYQIALERDEIEACAGDLTRFETALADALALRGLRV